MQISLSLVACPVGFALTTSNSSSSAASSLRWWCYLGRGCNSLRWFLWFLCYLRSSALSVGHILDAIWLTMDMLNILKFVLLSWYWNVRLVVWNFLDSRIFWFLHCYLDMMVLICSFSWLTCNLVQFWNFMCSGCLVHSIHLINR
jgi:hypothetical protein